jgi:hypothetical protein
MFFPRSTWRDYERMYTRTINWSCPVALMGALLLALHIDPFPALVMTVIGVIGVVGIPRSLMRRRMVRRYI